MAVAECDHGHIWAKRLVCGREYCPVCGEKLSEAHVRRFMRLTDRIRQMKSMGYLVIEWPLSERHKMRSRAAWRQARKTARKVLKPLGFDRGITRWHWFGDPRPDGSPPRGFNPHLNVLVDGGFLPKDRLEELREALRSGLNEPKLIVNYSYTDDPARMLHRARYITRATFSDWTWDPELVELLDGFRNGHWWGHWDGPPVWDLPTEEDKAAPDKALLADTCPDCGGHIHWRRRPETVHFGGIAGKGQQFVSWCNDGDRDPNVYLVGPPSPAGFTPLTPAPPVGWPEHKPTPGSLRLIGEEVKDIELPWWTGDSL